MTDLERFRNKLWERLRIQAQHHSGVEVIEALGAISKDLKEAGLDEVWESLSPTDWQEAGHMFDGIWIATLSARLAQQKKLTGHAT
jgi:hypothetical protein